MSRTTVDSIVASDPTTRMPNVALSSRTDARSVNVARSSVAGSIATSIPSPPVPSMCGWVARTIVDSITTSEPMTATLLAWLCSSNDARRVTSALSWDAAPLTIARPHPPRSSLLGWVARTTVASIAASEPMT